MAHVFANYGFDYSQLNFSRLYYDGVDASLEHNIYFNGRFYPDVATFTYYSDGYITGAFGGKDLAMDMNGVTGGTLTGYLELIGDNVLWGVEGISYSAKAMYNLVMTTSNGDDFKAIASILSGKDVFDMSDYADKGRGYAGNDTINGNSGNDALYGDDGNDIIRGGLGNDRLFGGLGNDTISLGLNRDTLVFNTQANNTLNHDTILDFKPVDDTIQLENAIFTKLNYTGVLHAGNFVHDKTGLAHDLNDFVVYETDTGKLFYDGNGSAAGGSVLIATFTNKAAIALADIVLI